jgi:hypothetical protein
VKYFPSAVGIKPMSTLTLTAPLPSCHSALLTYCGVTVAVETGDENAKRLDSGTI